METREFTVTLNVEVRGPAEALAKATTADAEGAVRAWLARGPGFVVAGGTIAVQTARCLLVEDPNAEEVEKPFRWEAQVAAALPEIKSAPAALAKIAELYRTGQTIDASDAASELEEMLEDALCNVRALAQGTDSPTKEG